MTLQDAYNAATSAAVGMTDALSGDGWSAYREDTGYFHKYAEDDMIWVPGKDQITFSFPNHAPAEVQAFVNEKLRVNIVEACQETVTILAKDAGIPFTGRVSLTLEQGGFDPFVCTHCGEADAADDHGLCVECKAVFDREAVV